MAVAPFTKIILGDLAEDLRARGFRRNGSTFIRKVDDGFVIVNLQASQFGTQARQRYTINLAVYSSRIQPLEKEESKIKEYEGHWRARLGKFLAPRGDKWWEVTSEEEARRAAGEMIHALPIALKAIESISTYDALIHIPRGPGTTSDDPPGWCDWRLINAAREHAGLPEAEALPYVEGWRDSWHRRHYPDPDG